MLISAFVFIPSLFMQSHAEAQNVSAPFQEMVRGFHSVPDSVRIAVYWYWMSDNVSVQGVERDLEAMKQAGITRAYIGIIGGQGVAYGKVKIFSDEWWKVLHAALKRATQLNIEIGVFNSPGWSQSGGPWVHPSQSMRYLASADTTVRGGRKLNIILPQIRPYVNKWNDEEQISNTFQTEREKAEDVRVIAYQLPHAKDEMTKRWMVKKKAGEDGTLEMPYESKQPARSLILKSDGYIQCAADLYAKIDNQYQLLKHVIMRRTNLHTQVGFDPSAPVVIAIPEVNTTAYRLVFAREDNCDVCVTLSSRPCVERYPEKSLEKMFQDPVPPFREYMWDRQPEVDSTLCVNPDKVVDLTDKVRGGTLTWHAPMGQWVISRLGMLTTGTSNGPTTPEARGLEVDKLSKRHVAEHFDAYIGEILRRIPEADRKSLKVVVADSYEMGSQNWTDSMADIFKSVYHYDPVPYLPVLNGVVVGSRDQSDRFLWDLRRLIADRVAYEYVGGLRDVSHRHGLTSWLENYGHWGFPAEFLQYGGQSDEIGGEFWAEGLGGTEVRDAASCAHIYGKPRVWCESCTAGGDAFGRYPGSLKQRIDKFFTEGVNSTLLHVYIVQPYEDKQPGLNAWFGTEFNRHNTWFSQMSTFTGYLRRVNFLLQQGKYVADVAYFIGEDTPKMSGERKPELPDGYSYDYINGEVLLQKAFVRNGQLCLPSGMSYKVLVLPDQTTMRPELLARIRQFVADGLTVVGPAPQHSPSLQNYPIADREVQRMAADLWGTDNASVHQFGEGSVYTSNVDLSDLLKRLGSVPDFLVDKKYVDFIPFIHRRMADTDIYFFTNQTADTLSLNPRFHVTGRAPQCWDATTGSLRALPQYTSDASSTTLPFKLYPYESSFVVFASDVAPATTQKFNCPDGNVAQSLAGPWDVTFLRDNKTVSFPTLTDWTKSPDPQVRYYSGTAVYRTTFRWKKSKAQSISIDLGNVMVMATVRLNGKEVGGVWTAPHRLDITPYLLPGKNTIEIAVVNNWRNRLIGDLNLPENERTTSVQVQPDDKNGPLQPSGLLGPVNIIAF
jgi:hypothetical protein